MIPAAGDVTLQPRTRKVCQALALIGGLTLLVGIFVAPERTWANLLLVSFALVSLGLGGILFIAIQYAAGGGWAVAFRRVPEAMYSVLPFGALGIALVLLLCPSLYSWTETHDGGHALTGFKHLWLNRPFFLGRAAFYVLVWLWLGGSIVRSSRRQDTDDSHAHTHKNVRTSALFLIVFGLTFCAASFDWIMSLEPHWFSTIFGVYNFAGMFLTALAVIVMASVWLQRTGPFRNALNDEHLHDLAKLIMTFSTFWAYIWFSQYMLIWYANNPEETGYYVLRQSGAWGSLLILNFVINWAIPFFVLLPRNAKRSPGILVKVAILLLFGRWLDLYLMILPAVTGEDVPFNVWEIALPAGAVGIFILVFVRALQAAPLIPAKDPYLEESLHHH